MCPVQLLTCKKKIAESSEINVLVDFLNTNFPIIGKKRFVIEVQCIVCSIDVNHKHIIMWNLVAVQLLFLK